MVKQPRQTNVISVCAETVRSLFPVGVLEVERSTLSVRRQKSFCRRNCYAYIRVVFCVHRGRSVLSTSGSFVRAVIGGRRDRLLAAELSAGVAGLSVARPRRRRLLPAV